MLAYFRSPGVPGVFRHLGVALLLLGFLASWPLGTQAAKERTPGRIDRLVKQLGSRKYAERAGAARALEALGPTALAALHRAQRHDDPEVRRLAARLIRRIGKRAEMEKLLTPTTVHLVYKDTPAADAIADLAKKSGLPVTYGGSLTKLAGRKVTLDTGKTTFWKALDQFCAAAGLVERGLVLAGKKRLTRPEVRRRPWGRMPPMAQPKKSPPRLVLVDGKTAKLPSCYFRGCRVRALPVTTPLEEFPLGSGEKAVALEVALELKRPLLKVVGLRFQKMVGDGGKNLSVAAELMPEEMNYSPYVYNPYNAAPRPGYAVRLENGQDEGNFRRVLVRVKGAKKLRELRGTVILEVVKPLGPVFSVADIRKAKDKTFRTPDGGSVTLEEVDIKKDRTVSLRVRSSIPLGGLFGGIRVMNGIVQVRRNMGGQWETVGIKPSNLHLLDAKGGKYRLSGTQGTGVSFAGNMVTQTVTLSFAPEKGQTAPVKLVYVGVAATTIAVPFKLKDVPVP
jgi:hypothetical protein